MEHPQLPPSAATSHSKLRLMCSYGGHIIPRPNFKSLCYFGGDNRIVAVDRRITTTVSSFTAHISAILLIHQPFAVKYHLPHHDLDSLISVATDDDLLIMFDEHDRLAASPTPSRVRLFLFPLKQQQPQPQPQPPRAQQQQQLANSPTDSWFSDALKSAKIMRRKDGFRDSGLSGGVDTACVEAQNEITTQESLVLETSSSFGSTSSSGSSSNSPPIWVRVEEGGINLQDSKVKFPKPDLILSQSDSASGISHTKTGINQDSVVDVASMDSRISSPQSNISSASSAQVYAPVQVSGYPMSAQLAQPPPPQQQQQMQFIQASSHYNYPTGPISSNSPLYHHPQLHYQSQTHYRPSQAYPIYLVPVNQTQPYNLSVQSNMIDTATTAAPSRPLMHSNVDLIPPQMAFKEVTTTMPAPELAPKVYRASPAAIPVHAPSTQNQQQPAGLQQVHHAPPPQSVANSPMEANSNGTNVGDDPAYNLIYKSQPPAPSMPSQFQTMAGAKALLLAGGFDEAACK